MSGNAWPSDTHRQLTGSASHHGFLGFRATALADTVGARLGMSLQELVDAFTAGPFYEWMMGKRIDPVELATSRRAFYRILPPAVRRAHVNEYDVLQHPSYCVACIADDTATCGIPYWHRSHEPFEATVCHIHGCRLFSGARAADLCLPDVSYRLRQRLISEQQDCAPAVEPVWIEKAVAEIAYHVFNARRERILPEAYERVARKFKYRFEFDEELVSVKFAEFIEAQGAKVEGREWSLRGKYISQSRRYALSLADPRISSLGLKYTDTLGFKCLYTDKVPVLWVLVYGMYCGASVVDLLNTLMCSDESD